MPTWKKLGLIFAPGRSEWMVSHAQNPFPEQIDEHIFKIHFSGRDKFNQARGGHVIIDIREPNKTLDVYKLPTLDLGKLGCFDDSGVMPSSIVSANNTQYMYYTGWTQAKKVPFLFFIGLAASGDGGKSYERISSAPVIGRNFHDPYLTAAPWVLRENDLWRMWYVSCTGWEGEAYSKSVKHYYRIKYAESVDGISWKTGDTICIDYSGDEYAIARPVVYRKDGLYRMWYCYRGGSSAYKAGYAESQDGFTWNRKDDDAGIDVSVSGWDSEMICYPCVFEHQGSQYMLYNGNDYGRTGFGLAVLEA